MGFVVYPAGHAFPTGRTTIDAMEQPAVIRVVASIPIEIYRSPLASPPNWYVAAGYRVSVPSPTRCVPERRGRRPRGDLPLVRAGENAMYTGHTIDVVNDHPDFGRESLRVNRIALLFGSDDGSRPLVRYIITGPMPNRTADAIALHPL